MLAQTNQRSYCPTDFDIFLGMDVDKKSIDFTCSDCVTGGRCSWVSLALLQSPFFPSCNRLGDNGRVYSNLPGGLNFGYCQLHPQSSLFHQWGE